ncbi:MAG: hypothetical protein ABI067_14350 [Leifsonia sp.]
MVEIALAGTRLANVALGHEAPLNSSAGRKLADPLNALSEDLGPVRRAHESVLFATLAAWDHARALSTLLRSHISSTVSIATVTRSGVEAFSRVHALLSAESTADLIRRNISLAIADLYFFIQMTPDRPLKRGTDTDVNAGETRTQLRDELRALDIGAELKMKPTRLAAEFLDYVFGGGARKYSSLSSVAHGESISIPAFAEFDTLGEPVRLVQPRDIVIEYVSYLVLGGAMLTNRLGQEFQPPLDEWERWVGARSRALTRLAEVDRTRQKHAAIGSWAATQMTKEQPGMIPRVV